MSGLPKVPKERGEEYILGRVVLMDNEGNKTAVTGGSLVVVGKEISEIELGRHYFVVGDTTLASGANIDFAVTVPAGNTNVFMRFKIEGTQTVSVDIREGAVISVAGSAVTAYNSNRNSLNTSTLTIQTDPSYDSEGIVLATYHVGEKRITGEIEEDEGMVLKAGSTYIYRITNETTTNNIISYTGKWHE